MDVRISLHTPRPILLYLQAKSQVNPLMLLRRLKLRSDQLNYTSGYIYIYILTWKLGIGIYFSLCAAAINQITKNFACEWAKDNIRSNSVAPWYIKTSLVEHVMSSILLILLPDYFIFLEMTVDIFRKMCGYLT